MLWLQKSVDGNLLYIRFLKGELVLQTEWFADNASIDLGIDNAPVGVSVWRFSKPEWPFTEDILTKYRLGPWADDLQTVKDAFFTPGSRHVPAGTKPRSPLH